MTGIRPTLAADLPALRRIIDANDLFPGEMLDDMAAAFLAGRAFLSYRRQGGTWSSTLPDFFIGAHAAVDELVLLTREAARYRTYFPTVQLVAPRT